MSKEKEYDITYNQNNVMISLDYLENVKSTLNDEDQKMYEIVNKIYNIPNVPIEIQELLKDNRLETKVNECKDKLARLISVIKQYMDAFELLDKGTDDSKALKMINKATTTAAITTKIATKTVDKPKEVIYGAPTVEVKKTSTTNYPEVIYGPPTATDDKLQAKKVNNTDNKEVLYGPPTTGSSSNNNQEVIYGPPTATAPSVPTPEKNNSNTNTGSSSNNNQEVIYGPPTATAPSVPTPERNNTTTTITISSSSTNNQEVIYGPPTATAPSVPAPEVPPTVSTSTTTEPTTTINTNPTTEYAPIPNTGIPDDNKGNPDLLKFASAASIGTAIGLVGRKIRKDKEKEEEKKKES